MGDLMTGTLGAPESDLDVDIFDRVQASEATMLHDSDEVGGMARGSRFASYSRVSIAGQPWMIIISSLPAFDTRLDLEKSRLYMFAGGAVSVLLSLLTWILASERERATRLAMDREALYRHLMMQANDAIVLSDVDRRIIEANDRASEHFGYAHSELLQMRLEELYPSEDVQSTLARFAALERTGSYRYETVHRRKDGSTCPSEVSARAIHVGDQYFQLSFVNDISRRKRIEEALKQSEFLWKFALEGAGDGVWDWDTQTNHVAFSDRFKELLGFAADEIWTSFDDWRLRVHPDDLPRAVADLAAHLEGRTRVYVNEHRLLCSDGSWKWILSRGAVVSRDAAGRPLRVIGTHSDISERKQREETLREREEHLRHLVLRSPVPMAINGATGEVETLNEQFVKTFGYTCDDIPNVEVWWALAYPDPAYRETVKRDWLQATGKALRDGVEIQPSDVQITCKDGSVRVVEIHGAIVGDRMLVVLNDITERIRLEEFLRENEERWHFALDGVGDGVWDWNVQSGIVKYSAGWKQMLGYAEDEIGNSFEEWESRVHPADISEAKQALYDYFEGLTRSFAIEHRLRCKDGGWKWVLSRGKALSCGSDGRPLRIVGSHSEISARKRIEEELIQLNETLEARITEEVARNRERDLLMANQSRLASMGEMIGNIAHQWRQPLNALSVLLANIKEAHETGELDADALADATGTGNRLVRQMSGTINDFLNFFRSDKEIMAFSARRQIEHAVALVGVSFKSDDVAIVVDAERDVILSGYPNEYAQALLNVLSNAREAILARGVPGGRVVIVLREQGGNGIVTVRDNGGGIADDAMPRIFDPYFSTKAMGTGVGLYMSKLIIENHMKGRLEARNTGDGAELTIMSPLAVSNANGPEA
jgi:PAS domain S-box-containing protein